jgi:thioredoxin 1
MKKTILTGILLLALPVAFMLTSEGCGKGNTDIPKNNTENQKVSNNNQNIKKGNMEHLTNQTFKEKVYNYETNKDWKFEGDLPCIVDFYADWCGPCKMVAPVLEELSNEYEGKIHIYKVDTEKEQELASIFGIRSIPSILFIPKDGQPQMSMGAMPKESFKQAIEEVLLKSKN